MKIFWKWFHALKNYQKVGLITALLAVIPNTIYQISTYGWLDGLIHVWLIIVLVGAIYAVLGWVEDV